MGSASSRDSSSNTQALLLALVREHLHHPGLAEIVVEYMPRLPEQLVELYRNGDWQRELEGAVHKESSPQKLRDALVLLLTTTEASISFRECYLVNFTPVAEALCYNSTLKKLDLRDNQFSDLGSLAEALRYNSVLRVLDLGRNRISDVRSLAVGLQHNTMLQELDLNSNRISDISGPAEALRHNSTLQELRLWASRISDISSLAEALRHNSTLCILDLSRKISDSVVWPRLFPTIPR